VKVEAKKVIFKRSNKYGKVNSIEPYRYGVAGLEKLVQHPPEAPEQKPNSRT
jgi:hypothetical protein